MDPREDQQRQDRAAQGPTHVALSVPDVALRAEKGLGGLAREQSGPPLDQFIKRREAQAHTDNQETQPPARPAVTPVAQGRGAQEEFAGELFFFTHLDSGKTDEVKRYDQLNLAYAG